MPWLTWTTGSPTLSSERSLISALTSLVCSWRRAPPRAGRRREQLGLGDELDRPRVVARRRVRAAKPCGERRDGDREALVAGLELGQRRDARRVDPAVAQQLEQALAPAFALGDDEDAVRRRRDVVLQALQRLGRAAVDAAGRAAAASPTARVRARCGSVVAAQRRAARASPQRGEELLGLQEQRFGRQERPLRGRAGGSGAARACRSRSAAAPRRPRRAAPASRRRRGSRRRSPSASKKSGR